MEYTKKELEMIFGGVPHPTKIIESELPGPALTAGTYEGFGKILFVPTDETTGELFEEPNAGEE